MTDTESQLLSFLDRCIENDPSLIVPADEDQPEQLAKLLGIAKIEILEAKVAALEAV